MQIFKVLLPLISVIACAFAAFGCNRTDSIVSVDAATFDKDIRTDSMQLLDVRTPSEYAEGHIAGAMNIDVQSKDFIEKAGQALNKDTRVLVYCRSGKRSLTAAKMLTKLGYQVVNLSGGITEWKEEGFPVVADGEPER